MNIQAAASSSYDATTMIVCLLYFALIVRVVSAARSPDRWEKIGLIVLALFVAHSKLVYAPMIFAAVALQPSMGWQRFIRLAVPLVIAGAAGILLTFGLGYSGNPGASRGPLADALSHQQMQFLLGHPLAAVQLVPNTLATFRDVYAIEFLGRLGWMDTTLPLPALVLIWASMLCAWAIDALKGQNPLGLGFVAAVIIGTEVGIAAIIFALYVLWTAPNEGVGVPLATGVQGRYFIPFAPFVMAALAHSPKAVAARSSILRLNLTQAHITVVRAMLTLTVFTIVLRYWIA
jgi:uncharacterized membrane protein